ncbi:MAG: hypothetical protein IPK99_11050 [Flavobacteriales bacterium]|nr:hypothetical protein [Flavobacteriales bacterium]
MMVSVTPLPTVSITPDPAVICAGGSTTLTATGSPDNSLASVLSSINANSASLIASIPTPSGFNMDLGVNATNISDGCSDMYDGGNYINTNLGSAISYSDNAITPSVSFGTGGQYFTRYLGPGGCQTGPATLFFWAADINGLSSMSITGNNGADGQGTQDTHTFTVTANGITYTAFLKRVYNAFDPSINQLFLIPQPNSASQTIGVTTDDSQQNITGLTGVTRVFYMLYAGASGAFINNAQATTIAQNFANIIPTANSYSWSPGGATTAAITVSPASTTTYTVTYNNGICSNTATREVTVNRGGGGGGAGGEAGGGGGALPVVTCGTYGPVCEDAADITLGGSPTGGTWSGTGVTGNSFDPSVGTQLVTYSYTDGNGCTASCQTTITVNELPVVTCGTYGPVCEDAADITLGGSPSGGTWSGTGVTAGVFDPSAGTQLLTYNYTDGNGCSGLSPPTVRAGGSYGLFAKPLTHPRWLHHHHREPACHTDGTVGCSTPSPDVPTVTCDGPYGPFCSADAAITLGGNPSGGTWSGTGVSGNQFDPGAAANGANNLTYSYTDGNGCTDDCAVVVNVDAVDSDGDGTADCGDDCPLAVNSTPNLNTTTCNCELGYYATTTAIGLNG